MNINSKNWFKYHQVIICLLGILLIISNGCKKNGEKAVIEENKRIISYKNDIQPILVSHCYSCHSLSATDPQRPGYAYLDIFEQLQYYALSPSTRNPSYTTIQARIRFIETPGMPYKKAPLTDSLIKKIDAWVKAGAPNN